MLPTAIVAFACSRPASAPEQQDEAAQDTDRDTDPDEVTPTSEVVTLTTRDGVSLVADWYPATGSGRPVVVLLHMTPKGGWTRKDWPATFIDALRAKSWAVLALDRRGAGDSGGVAEDAYLGEGGRYDVEAAANHAVSEGAGPLAILGASNGTTSMVDYAAWAGSEALPVPVALGYLSGGTYTENQTQVANLPKLPAVFAYPETESAWPEEKKALDTDGSWTFKEYSGDAHGTKLFDAHPEITTDLVEFLDSPL